MPVTTDVSSLRGAENVTGQNCESSKRDARKSVSHPDHYNHYPIEVIEIIKKILGSEGFKAYCFGNEIKYRMRAGFKNDQSEDIAKAMMYKKFREQE